MNPFDWSFIINLGGYYLVCRWQENLFPEFKIRKRH